MTKKILNQIVKDIMAMVGKRSGLVGYEQAKKQLTGMTSDEYEYCIRQIVKKLKI